MNNTHAHTQEQTLSLQERYGNKFEQKTHSDTPQLGLASHLSTTDLAQQAGSTGLLHRVEPLNSRQRPPRLQTCTAGNPTPLATNPEWGFFFNGQTTLSQGLHVPAMCVRLKQWGFFGGVFWPLHLRPFSVARGSTRQGQMSCCCSGKVERKAGVALQSTDVLIRLSLN